VYRARSILVLSLACTLLLAGAARGAPSPSLDVSFSPDRLGASTTVHIGFTIASPAGEVPAPLTGFYVSYPDALGFDVSGLGLATCPQANLEAFGPKGCPADSRMGRGSALAKILVGAKILREAAKVEVFRGAGEGRFALLIYADGTTPIDAPVVFPGLLVSGPGSDESIRVSLPLIPSFPEAPDVAVVRLNTALGPDGLTYYEHIGGQLVAYRPQGVLLPKRCPAGGFVFGASFSFLGGRHARAHAVVPCQPSAAPTR
jgi:hypothetical protein